MGWLKHCGHHNNGASNQAVLFWLICGYNPQEINASHRRFSFVALKFSQDKQVHFRGQYNMFMLGMTL